jgi:hypothetical protein
MSNKPQNVEEIVVPDEFYKIINDFITDILITFPEYSGIVSRWWNQELADSEERTKQCSFVFRHCVKVFPERFFDILYKNVDIFKESGEENTEFLPGIVFKHLWAFDISDSTRETIWKYLQLVLFSVIGSVHNSSDLGDTAKLFEAINEDELKSKLEETLHNMENLFTSSANGSFSEGDDSTDNQSGNNDETSGNQQMPNAEDLHKHIQSMMGGKLGKLAMELAEETAQDLNLDMENASNANDMFQKLFKNPGKLMSMVKNIGGKIDAKIKSGEIKESELMSEGMDLLNKMQSMPGMDNMQKMFSQMGIPGLGKGGKLNMGAMEAQMNKNMKAAKMRERMKSKVDAKNNSQQTATPSSVAANLNQQNVTDEEIIKIFSTGEKVEKTPRGAKPPQQAKMPQQANPEGKKKKKNK